jgi:hypothetical protein
MFLFTYDYFIMGDNAITANDHLSYSPISQVWPFIMLLLLNIENQNVRIWTRVPWQICTRLHENPFSHFRII